MFGICHDGISPAFVEITAPAGGSTGVTRDAPSVFRAALLQPTSTAPAVTTARMRLSLVICMVPPGMATTPDSRYGDFIAATQDSGI
jgi:hypothetical protein